MSKQAIKTNNDPKTLEAKIQLRLRSLPEKQTVRVLDAFGGQGVLWTEVKKRTDKSIQVLSIDKNDYSTVNLRGDNMKFLKTMNLDTFDIIDLDAYGSPSNQLDILKSRGYKGIVHCTFIQTMFGSINKNILKINGYTPEMIKKCKSLFNKDGIDKILNYIALSFNIERVTIVTYQKKNYFYFEII